MGVACLAASRGQVPAARALDTLLAEAMSHGYAAFQYQAWLLQGQLELAAGRTETARIRLDQLERDARASGYRLIARKASSAR